MKWSLSLPLPLTAALAEFQYCTVQKDCSTSCPVHCYKPAMRQKIKEVMRMAGPRMLFLHPIETVKHFHKERQRDRHFATKTKATQKTE